MKKINYIAAIVLTIFWAIGFFNHRTGSEVHFLLIGAFVFMLMNVVEEDNTNSPNKV